MQEKTLDSSDIELWGKFIRAERKKEFDVLAEKMHISEVPISIYRLSVRMKKNGWNMRPEQRLFGIITRLYWKRSRGEKYEEEQKEKQGVYRY